MGGVEGSCFVGVRLAPHPNLRILPSAPGSKLRAKEYRMSDEFMSRWPPRPSDSAYVLHGLCVTLADIVQEEVCRELSQKTAVKLAGVASAAELFAAELAHWFASRPPDQHEQLEALLDQYPDTGSK